MLQAVVTRSVGHGFRTGTDNPQPHASFREGWGGLLLKIQLPGQIEPVRVVCNRAKNVPVRKFDVDLYPRVGCSKRGVLHEVGKPLVENHPGVLQNVVGYRRRGCYRTIG